MIDVVVIDICSLILAPELRVRLALSELEKDGMNLVAFGDIPRDNLRHALKKLGYLQYFDSLLYDSIMPELSSEELRRLAAPSTLWLRHPHDLNYSILLNRLPPRRRMLPKMLRVKQQLNSTSILNIANDLQLPEPHED